METKHAKSRRRRISLGQHMLMSETVADKLVEACSLSQSARVLEIGTGLGVLTSRLAEKSAFVKSFEIDEHLFETVRKSLSRYENVELLLGDAFEHELNERFDVCITSLPYSQSL